jgi:hypothetical protein
MAVSSATNAVLDSGAIIGGISINTGSGNPSNVLTATKGSLFIRTDTGGSTSATRLYVNSTGSSIWVAVTTAS